MGQDLCGVDVGVSSALPFSFPPTRMNQTSGKWTRIIEDIVIYCNSPRPFTISTL